jgi:hypothetical protein
MLTDNIELLSERLITLGFPSTVVTQLKCHICFAPRQFDLCKQVSTGTDQCLFSVRFEKEANEQYQMKYYIATLRRPVVVPQELTDIDRKMAAIDWGLISDGRLGAKQQLIEKIEEATALFRQLQELGPGADLLRYKYWLGTDLENLILFPPQHKASWEISERFYFFSEMDQISFSEAIRFLNSRWMERQLQSRKKMEERSLEAEGGDNGRGLLLKKKSRNGSRKNLLKK